MPAALRLALVALLVGTRITTAQETATEQVAAADVIRRMSELERSLALPQLVARLAGARDARRDAVIARAKDLMDRELLAMADDITRHPGTVTVYGTPAEELASPAAKTVMYNAGVFKGADVLIRSHSSTATQAPGAGFGSCCMNINVVHYTFSGAPAHQLQAWDGRDALM